jgi:hypothetical protein
LWSIVKTTGRPLHESLTEVWNWPNTITLFVALRQKYDSFMELSEVPPEEHWDYPRLIRQHIEKLYPGMRDKSTTDINLEEVED